MRRSLVAAALALALLAAPAGATTDVLYDGTLGSTPDTQGWIYASFPLMGARATRTADGATTILDTTPTMRDLAGYFYTRRAPAPPMDRSEGFRLLFSLQIKEERHVSRNRAGFSLIVLSSDLKGVELGFWEDQIWAQSDRPLFTRGERSRHFNTSARMVDYALAIRGDSYALSAGGATILIGMLKDYSSFNTPPFDFVYRQPNFIFLGDNTGSAAARIALTSIKIESPAEIETPATPLRPPRKPEGDPAP
jgi:hypothetical protein